MALSNRRPIPPDSGYLTCSERVFTSGSIRGRSCSKRPIVEYDETYSERVRSLETLDQPGWEGLQTEVVKSVEKTRVVRYCGTHDPHKVAEREEKRREAWDEERARRTKIQRIMEELQSRLGCGLVEYDPGQGPTGYLKLSSDSVRKLLTELGR